MDLNRISSRIRRDGDPRPRGGQRAAFTPDEDLAAINRSLALFDAELPDENGSDRASISIVVSE